MLRSGRAQPLCSDEPLPVKRDRAKGTRDCEIKRGKGLPQSFNGCSGVGDAEKKAVNEQGDLRGEEREIDH